MYIALGKAMSRGSDAIINPQKANFDILHEF